MAKITNAPVSYLSYWQLQRWHRSHEFWLIVLLLISIIGFWLEPTYIHKAAQIINHNLPSEDHITKTYERYAMLMLPSIQILYALSTVCFDIMLARFGWILILLNSLLAAGQLVFIWHSLH
jgi:flagellar biosynthesis protein FlhB